VNTTSISLRLTAVVLTLAAVAPLIWSRPNVPHASPPAAPTRLDFNGDPLPLGAMARIGTVRFRHGANVRQVAFTPDSKTLYTTCYGEKVVHAWSVADGREKRQFGGTSDVGCIAVSPDGKLLATGESDESVRLWDAATGQETRRLTLAPNDRPVGDDQVRLFVMWARFTPDGKSLVASYSYHRLIVIWDVATGKVVRRITTDGPIMAADMSADGKWLSAAHAGGAVGVWELASGRLVQTVKASARQMMAVALSPDGKLLVTASADQAVQFWEVESGKEIRNLTLSVVGPSLAFARDSATLAVGYFDGEDGGVVALFDPKTGTETRRLGSGITGSNTVMFAPDGKTLVATSGNSLRLWNTATGEEVRLAAGHPGGITTIAASPDGKTVATCSVHDKSVRLWDSATGREVRRFDGHAVGVDEVQFSPDGKLLASASWNQPVRIWDVATGRLVRTLVDHPSLGPYMRFADDNKTLATGSKANTVALWDCTTGKVIRELTAPPHGLASVLSFNDGRLLAYETPDRDDDDDTTIGLWDLTADRLVRRFNGHTGKVNGVILSADSRLLASRASDKTIRVWEVATGMERVRFDEPGGIRMTASWTGTQFLSFSPDGRVLVTCASDDSFARRWDLMTRQELPPFAGHGGWLGALEFSANGRILVTGSQDTTALVWDGREVVPRAAGSVVHRTAAELATLWESLGERDAAKAHGAIWSLVGAGDDAATFVGERLRPAAPVDTAAIARWINDLDDAQFPVRERATAALAGVADQAAEALRAELERTRSAEVRQRIRRIFDGAHDADLSPDRLRELRAIEVLEALATPTARERLQVLAGGAAGAFLTREAKAALTRLGRRQ
jgi:WD40 repeat protein